MPGFIGIPELLLLGLVVLVIFGPKRLPEMGRSLGQGFRELKNSITRDEKNTDQTAADVREQPIELPVVRPVETDRTA